MLVRLELAAVSADVKEVTLERVHLGEGEVVTPGAKLVDVRVDLSTTAAQDCPPVFHLRLVARERGVLRRLLASAGQRVGVGQPLAVLSSEADEPLDGEPVRALRINTVAITVDPLFG
jgi:pyruvate/2-oxoglutarate dehydrogenase complex dihydrolipoamide acyltransferase (E2) component